MQPLKIFSKTTQQNSEIFYPNGPWVKAYVIKVCSRGGATCIVVCNTSILNTESLILEN